MYLSVAASEFKLQNINDLCHTKGRGSSAVCMYVYKRFVGMLSVCLRIACSRVLKCFAIYGLENNYAGRHIRMVTSKGLLITLIFGTIQNHYQLLQK